MPESGLWSLEGSLSSLRPQVRKVLPADVKGFTQIYDPDFHFGLCTTFPAFFFEIHEKLFVRMDDVVQNTFRWPRGLPG